MSFMLLPERSIIEEVPALPGRKPATTNRSPGVLDDESRVHHRPVINLADRSYRLCDRLLQATREDRRRWHGQASSTWPSKSVQSSVTSRSRSSSPEWIPNRSWPDSRPN